VVAWAARFAATTIVIIGALTVWRGAWPASQTSSGTSVTAQEYATAPGRRDTVRLLDGTRIVLGPASRLRVTAGFAIGVREVTLTGEALFTVAHDAARPFRVRASHAIVEDVGTTFNVRAYESDATTTVVVAQGRVIVRADTAVVAVRRTSDVTLEAGMLGIVADGAVRVEHDVDLTRHIAWAEGRLVFRNTPLREALPQIARWYDVDVRLADTALAGRRITGTFEAESADYVLQLVTQSLGLVYERRGRLVIVGPANGGR
jgi:transmembrane sensor